MSSYISPDRHGEGDSLLRELAATRAVQPGPAHPRTPVPPPEPPPPPRRAWGRWVVGAAVLVALLLGEWWLRQAPPETSSAGVTGPVATIVEIRGTVDVDAGAPEASPAKVGAPLYAHADLKTESGELTLRTADGAVIHLAALSRLTFSGDGTPELQFGRIEVDTTAQPDTAPAGWIRTVVTGTRLAGDGAVFSIQSAVHADISVRSGAVVLDQGGVTYRLEGGDCPMVLRSGFVLTTPGTCQ
jgi:hypothetical protein